jgi:hypothetical protein
MLTIIISRCPAMEDLDNDDIEIKATKTNELPPLPECPSAARMVAGFDWR